MCSCARGLAASGHARLKFSAEPPTPPSELFIRPVCTAGFLQPISRVPLVLNLLSHQGIAGDHVCVPAHIIEQRRELAADAGIGQPASPKVLAPGDDMGAGDERLHPSYIAARSSDWTRIPAISFSTAFRRSPLR